MENAPARTLVHTRAADWLAAAGTLMGGVRSAVRAFGGALRKRPRHRRSSADRRPVPPPAPGVEPGELPQSYGRNRVVAMVVSPYLIHVYWDLAGGGAGEPAPASLRLHDTAADGWFDVNIDLAARNWYVHLWSPHQSYYVELGVHRQEGFLPMARSNPIETPRAWPVAETAAPAHPAASLSELPARPFPKFPQAAPAVAPAASVPAASHPGAGVRAPGESEVSVPRPALPPAPAPVGATDLLHRRLSELYAFRRWERAPGQSAEPVIREALPPGPHAALGPAAARDLTARAEALFSPGISSMLLGAPARKPAG